MRKIYIAITLLFALFIASCDTTTTSSKTAANDYADSLREAGALKDSIINEMLGSFNEIRENLKEIQGSEGQIQLKVRREGEVEDVRATITEDVERINALMKKNEQLIDQLNKRLSASQIEMREFKRLITELNEDVKNKNIEIHRLNELLAEKELMLVDLYSKVDSLSLKSRSQEKELQSIIEEVNRGYFTYGTFKELRDKNVITKEGGFLGIGKSKSLKDDFNREYFTEVDIQEQKSFLIYAAKAKLITNHPTASYEFVGEKSVDSLIILDPEAFWETSRYMVVLIE